MDFRLPDDLHAAMLAELPPTWFIEARCGGCKRSGSWTVWWLIERHGWTLTVGAVIARARCRCRARATSALLREAPSLGQGGVEWIARTVPILIPAPVPPVVPEEVPQIDVDWGG